MIKTTTLPLMFLLCMSLTHDAWANKLKVFTGGLKATSMTSKSIRTARPTMKISSQFSKVSKPLPAQQMRAAQQFTKKATTKAPLTSKFNMAANPSKPVANLFVKPNGKHKPVITYTHKQKGQVQMSARVRSQNKGQSKEYIKNITPQGGKVGTGMKHTRVNGTVVQSKTYPQTPVQPVTPKFNLTAKR